MNNKKFLAFGIGIVLVILGLNTLVSPAVIPVPAVPTPSPLPQINRVTLLIDYGNGQKSTHIRDYAASESAFTLLEKITTEKQLPFIFKKYPFGNLIESINNIKNTSQKAWIYFVNSGSPTVGADQYQLQPGDTVEWKYVTPK